MATSTAHRACFLGLLLVLLRLPGGVAALESPGSVAAITRGVAGVTFAHYPGTLYAPLSDLAAAFGWPLRWERTTRTIPLREIEVSPGAAGKGVGFRV